MKTIVKVKKTPVVKAKSAPKRATTAKQDIAALTEILHVQRTATTEGLESHQLRIASLDEKMSAIDGVMHSVDATLTQCQDVVVSVREMLEVQIRELAEAVAEAGREHRALAAVVAESASAHRELTAVVAGAGATHHELASAVSVTGTAHLELAASVAAAEEERKSYAETADTRIEELDEKLRSTCARHAQLQEAMDLRVKALEEQLPQLGTVVASLETDIDKMVLIQTKINARIITVMRMSVITIGVLVVTATVLGFLLIK